MVDIIYTITEPVTTIENILIPGGCVVTIHDTNIALAASTFGNITFEYSCWQSLTDRDNNERPFRLKSSGGSLFELFSERQLTEQQLIDLTYGGNYGLAIASILKIQLGLANTPTIS